jgi:hypothetical protein
MLSRKLIVAIAAAILLSLSPNDSRAAGKSDAPGQAARDCAKMAEPKAKDDCVRAAREAEKKGKKGGKKDKSKGKNKAKSKDKGETGKGNKGGENKGKNKDKKKS